MVSSLRYSKALGVIAVAIAIPLFPVSRWLGFVVPPPLFFVFLIGATSAYLAIVEINERSSWPDGHASPNTY